MGVLKGATMSLDYSVLVDDDYSVAANCTNTSSTGTLV